MRFDYAIGNPPYQVETDSDSTRMPPVYDSFLDSAYQVADRVMMIHPARFLFDSGYTPRDWNEKMRNDPHLKVVKYMQKSGDVFKDTDIKGGIVVTYRDATAELGPIGLFVVFEEQRSILGKMDFDVSGHFDQIMYSALSYRFSDVMKQENPDKLDRFRTSAFTKLDDIFHEEKPDDGHEYIQVMGLADNARCMRWVRRNYLVVPDNFEKYKVFIPKANGSGALGEVLSTPLVGLPLVGLPLVGHTQTFMSIGCFDTESEADACLKYVKTKFARAMLGVLKITQDNPPEKWKYVPLQDFTDKSDIDWTKTVHEIDLQLYAKYGLDDNEISFIEEKVRAME